MLDQGVLKPPCSHSQKTVLDNVVRGWGPRSRTFSSDYFPAGLPDTARSPVSDTSNYGKTPLDDRTEGPAGRQGQSGLGSKTSARRMQQRHVLKPCFSDWILLSELETGSGLPSLFWPHIFISQNAHWRSSMKSTGKRIEKQMLMIKIITFALKAEQPVEIMRVFISRKDSLWPSRIFSSCSTGKGALEDHNKGCWHECPVVLCCHLESWECTTEVEWLHLGKRSWVGGSSIV